MVEVVDMAMMMDAAMALEAAEMTVTALETEITAMMYLEQSTMTWRTVGLESRLEKSLDIVKVDDDDDDENDRFGDGWAGDGGGDGWGEGADPECDITYGNSEGSGITFGYGDVVPNENGDGVSSS